MGLPFLMAVLAAGAVVYTVLAWNRGFWRVAGRIHYTLATLAAVAFTVLGLVASLAGTLFGTTSKFWPALIVVVCVVMGGQILFFPRFELPMPRRVTPRVGGAVGAFLLGALTGVIATPCAMPVRIFVSDSMFFIR